MQNAKLSHIMHEKAELGQLCQFMINYFIFFTAVQTLRHYKQFVDPATFRVCQT